MRVCLLSATIAPDAVGGRGKYARELYNALNELGIDVTVVTGLWNRKIKDPNIIQVKIPHYRYVWLPFWVRVARRILRKRKFDVVHINGERESLGYTGSYPAVTTIHDLGAVHMNMHLLKFILKRNTKSAIRIITPSEVVRNELCRTYPLIKKDTVITIHNGVNFNVFHQGLDHMLIRRRYNIRGLMLLYLGRIAKYKGIEHILSAFEQLRKEYNDLSLVIAGSPSINMKKTYKTWQTRHSDVFFAGRVSDAEVPFYYAAADCFVTYSYAGEGFGLTLAEAMACGTPVICSDLPAFREVVDDHGILVPANNQEKLATAIRSILENPELRISLGKAGANHIRKNFNWANTAKKHIEVYEKAINACKI
ncbi:MAG: glycosyltransferase family 4 protein [Candidatus Ranarchaeia archaeon]